MSSRRERRGRSAGARRASRAPICTGAAAWYLGAGVLAFAALVGLVLLLRPSMPQPGADAGAPGRLEARPAMIDLGRVPFDRLVEARYELVNTGGQPVRLLGAPAVKTLDGC